MGPKKSGGFSLIEVVLALAILVLGLVGVLLLFPVGLKASRDAAILSEAALVAQSRIEELKVLGLEGVGADGVEGIFAWNILMEEVAPEAIQDPSYLKKATVTVSWDRGGKTRKEFFTTIINDEE